MATRNITITLAAMAAIRSASTKDFKASEIIRMGPDAFQVPLSEETIERLNRAALKGESLSETIIRAISLQRGAH